MKTFQIKLQNIVNILTPFQADTIFGHLCWVVAHDKGDKELKNFLEPFVRGGPPFIISDGFPGDFLPKPLTVELFTDKQKREDRKKWKKIDLLEICDFESVRRGEICVPKDIPDGTVSIYSKVYNTINRLNNTTLAEGGVYSLKEMSISSVSIYIKTESEDCKNQVVNLFEKLSKAGYGRKKSIGKGHFLVSEVKNFEVPKIENANGFVTLSNFCPAKNDPTDGLYKTFVKYGKLGEEYTFCGNPFKKPILMIKAGSVFKTNGEPKEFYGRMISEGISPAKPEVVHYAYAFAVPIIFP
ncbi:MAG: type III-A CRISPR-associated RAMP protein Csm4 [Thermodesulfobacteriota bacterium]